MLDEYGFVEEEGYFPLSRKFFSHPFWKTKRKFSRAEAWLDILRHASWKDENVERLIAGRLIIQKYGEAIMSTRYCGRSWGWHKTSVVRFISFLENAEMCVRNCDQGITKIIVLNFSKYDPRKNRNVSSDVNLVCPECVQGVSKLKTIGKDSIYRKRNIKEKEIFPIVETIDKINFDFYKTKTEAHERIVQTITETIQGLGLSTSREHKVYNVNGNRNGFIDIICKAENFICIIEVDSCIRRKSIQKLQQTEADLKIQLIYTKKIDKNYNPINGIWFLGRELFCEESASEKLIERYDGNVLIEKAIAAISTTRKSGKIADSVKIAILKKWDSQPVENVLGGIRKYLAKNYAAEGKREEYLYGIIRNYKPGTETIPRRHVHEDRTYQGTPENEISWLDTGCSGAG